MRSLLACILASLGSTTCFASNGPIGHWTFNEGRGSVVFDSAGRNNGAVIGAPTFVPGVQGTALSFHRSTGDCVDVGNLPLFDFASNADFSVSMWVQYTVGSTGDHYPVSNHYITVKNGWLCFTGVSGGCYGDPKQMSFYVSDSCGGEVTSPINVFDGAWHHVVSVFDGGVSRGIFVDGGPVDAQGPSGSMAVHPLSRLLFGGVTNTNGQPLAAFDGLLDDVQIYDRVLNCAEVNYLRDHPGAAVAIVADLDGDGDVDGADLATMLGAWGPCGASCAADLDCSGAIGAADLAVLLGAWTG